MGNAASDSAMSCDMCRKSDAAKTRVVKNPDTSKAQQAGIGAVFTVDSDNRIVFCASAVGSSSHDAIERGLLKRGDVLVAIDGVEMAARSMHDVAARLLGPPGSLVMVRFRRKEKNVHVENTIAMDRRPMQIDAIRKVAESVRNPNSDGNASPNLDPKSPKSPHKA